MRSSMCISSAGRRYLLAVATLLFTLSAVHAADISVPIDQARIVKLKGQAAGVIVGNPSIADVSVQNGRMLVVTGKSYGITNIIVLGDNDQPILSKKVSVGHDTGRIVTVHKGPDQFSFSCRPTCKPALLPGDAESYFEPLAKATRNKLSIAQAVVDGTQAPQ